MSEKTISYWKEQLKKNQESKRVKDHEKLGLDKNGYKKTEKKNG